MNLNKREVNIMDKILERINNFKFEYSDTEELYTLLDAGWIHITEQKPERLTPVLVFGKCCEIGYNIKIAQLEDDWFESGTGEDLRFEPTFWMKLPYPAGSFIPSISLLPNSKQENLEVLNIEKYFKKTETNIWCTYNDYIIKDTINCKYSYYTQATIHCPIENYLNSNRLEDRFYKIILHRYYTPDNIEQCLDSVDSILVYKGLIENNSDLEFLLYKLGII